MKRLVPLALGLAALLLSPACTTSVQGGMGAGADAGADDPPPDPNAPDAGSCAEAKVELRSVTPTVMVLVDRSGTMTEGFGGTTRWQATYDTLMNPSSGVVKSLEDEVRFGLALYTSDDGFAGGACPILDEVSPRLGNYDAMNSVYASRSPVEDTPTGAALQAMTQSLGLVGAEGPKIIVLATDGEPDTCTDPDPDGQEDAKLQSIQAAQTAHEAGIETYIISVGNEVGEAHLADMANAGAGLPIGGPEQAPYYRALDADQLVNAFEEIISGVRRCTFTLEGEVDPDKAESGTVTLDGRELEHGSEWRLEDSTTLEILGEACEDIKDGGDHVVEAEFTCGSIIL